MYKRPVTFPPRSNFDDVGDFQHQFGLDSTTHYLPGPRDVPNDLLTMRLNFLLEELMEIMVAVGARFQYIYDPEGTLIDVKIEVVEGKSKDYAQYFDGLIDLVYVAMGTAQLEGMPWQEGWDQVQEANMAKRRAKKDASDSLRGSSFDVVKPEGWKPPNIAGVLGGHGFPINPQLDVD